ncbi:hypothetical protein ACFLYQ_06310 [Chloroflexota bacterium]
MKYRVRLDLSFEKEADARSLLDFAGTLTDRAVSINEGKTNEEIAFTEIEICRHDEGLPCQVLERVEIRKI